MFGTLLKWLASRQPLVKASCRRRIRLALEILEDRWVPAVLTVNQVTDIYDDAGGVKDDIVRAIVGLAHGL